MQTLLKTRVDSRCWAPPPATSTLPVASRSEQQRALAAQCLRYGFLLNEELGSAALACRHKWCEDSLICKSVA